MKHIRMKRFSVWMACLFGMIATSCSKPYFEDTGIHNDTFDGTVWEYLNSKPEHFSLMTKIIQEAGMENEFMAAGDITLFAPKNPSIEKAIFNLNRELESIGKDTIADFAQIKPEVWREFVSLYVVPGSIELKDIVQVDTTTYAYKGQTYKSLNGRSMNIGLMYHSAGGVKYAGYRQIIYAYIRDFSFPEASRINGLVATSNNRTRNGMVHVLEAYRHMFPFDFDTFFERVSTVGLVTP